MTLSPEAGMVFRRCRSRSEERAVGRLLAERGMTLAVAGADLFGLWDLTAPAGDCLVAGAATGPLGNDGEVRLRGIAVAASAEDQGLDRRLVCGVADSLRARGAARLVARPVAGPDGGGGPTAAQLRGVGFAPADDQGGWWDLEL